EERDHAEDGQTVLVADGGGRRRARVGPLVLVRTPAPAPAIVHPARVVGRPTAPVHPCGPVVRYDQQVPRLTGRPETPSPPREQRPRRTARGAQPAIGYRPLPRR